MGVEFPGFLLCWADFKSGLPPDLLTRDGEKQIARAVVVTGLIDGAGVRKIKGVSGGKPVYEEIIQKPLNPGLPELIVHEDWRRYRHRQAKKQNQF